MARDFRLGRSGLGSTQNAAQAEAEWECARGGCWVFINFHQTTALQPSLVFSNVVALSISE